MKTTMVLIASAILASDIQGQGQFVFANPTAPSRIGSISGPLAGPGIWAQMLVGQSSNTLAPLGIAVEHSGNGYVFGGSLTVPDTLTWPDPLHAYVQMVAWNGAIWGTSLDGVPPNQLGRTDTVLTPLGYPPGPNQPPPFTKPAIVPSGPQMSITVSATNTILFSWPTEQTAYAVQQNPDLSPNNWVTLPNTPVTVGQQQQAIVSVPSSGRMFYRLVSQ